MFTNKVNLSLSQPNQLGHKSCFWSIKECLCFINIVLPALCIFLPPSGSPEPGLPSSGSQAGSAATGRHRSSWNRSSDWDLGTLRRVEKHPVWWGHGPTGANAKLAGGSAYFARHHKRECNFYQRYGLEACRVRRAPVLCGGADRL